MKENSKTVSKQNLKPVDNTQIATTQADKKCKSMVLPNYLVLTNIGGDSCSFPVYRDSQIGMGGALGDIVIPMRADEDVESTKSMIEYGQKTG